MSLNWNLTKINNYMEVCWVTKDDGSEELNPETNALIWATMAVGMGNITEDSASDFYSRIRLYEKMFGTFLMSFDDNGKKEHPITPEVVNRHIGLHTNVSKETDASFRKRMFENFFRESKMKFENDMKNEDVLS